MFEKQKQIGGYRLRQTEQSAVIDEQKGVIGSILCLIFGLGFMFPLYLFGALMLKRGVLDIVRSDYSQYWLGLSLFLCLGLGFAFIGFLVAFARYHIEVTGEKVLMGRTWFGVPVKLKATPVSEIVAIRLKWERRGILASGWFCDVSILSAKKSVSLFSCSKKEASLKLANAVAEITKLPVQDILQS